MKQQSGMQINYVIGEVRYYDSVQTARAACGYGMNQIEPVISLRLDNFHFQNGVNSHVWNGSGLMLHYDSMRLFLDQIRFYQLTGRDWDGTKAGVEKHKDLEGKVYTLNLTIE